MAEWELEPSCLQFYNILSKTLCCFFSFLFFLSHISSNLKTVVPFSWKVLVVLVCLGCLTRSVERQLGWGRSDCMLLKCTSVPFWGGLAQLCLLLKENKHLLHPTVKFYLPLRKSGHLRGLWIFLSLWGSGAQCTTALTKGCIQSSASWITFLAASVRNWTWRTLPASWEMWVIHSSAKNVGLEKGKKTILCYSPGF